MAVSAKATAYVSGKLYWAKITGEPRLNYAKDGREWAFELEPDAKGLETLKKYKLTDRLKDKEGPDRKVLTLRKSEFNKDGNPNPPIRIYDSENQEWDTSKLVGNESSADVKLDIRDYGVGKKKGVYPVAIRITDLVVYQSSEFGAMDKDEEPQGNTKAKQVAKDFAVEDLDDEVTF